MSKNNIPQYGTTMRGNIQYYRIEGNTLTLQETALVLEGVTIDKKPLKDHLEAVGHRDAFLYVQELVKNSLQ